MSADAADPPGGGRGRPLRREGQDLILKAFAVALRRVPEANASLMGDSIHLHRVVDVSVAVAIGDGLVTPVVRDAVHKSVRDIAREAQELAGRVKQQKLAPRR